MFDSINWSVFFGKQFWFGIDRVGGIALTDKIILWAGVGLLVVGILIMVYRIMSKNVLIKPVLGRISSVFITLGLLEMFWFLLRTQFVNTLGTRFTALLILVIGLAFFYSPLKYFLKKYRHDLVNYEREQIKQKYLQKK
jgi:hypothetical protein